MPRPRPSDGRLPLPWRWRLLIVARQSWAAVHRPKIWRALGGVLIVVSAVMATYQAGPGACRARHLGRTDTRAAITAGVDEVGGYYEIDPRDRQAVVGRVETRVAHELPPPDCWAWPPP